MIESSGLVQTSAGRLRADCVRIIVDDPLPGYRNMGIDEALLESVDSGGPPVFRLYSFSPTTLSVGRFQRTRDLFDFRALRRDGVEFVRRPSGGQAVLHSDEITYSCALAKKHLEGFSKRAVYRFIIPLLIAGLDGLGIRDARLITNIRGRRSDPDCFATGGEYEVDNSNRRKLIGSAQMITRNAVLQHGSIPLSPAYRSISRYFLHSTEKTDTYASSIEEELGKSIEFPFARGVFEQILRESLGAVSSELGAEEEKRSVELSSTKYRSVEWNERR